MCQQQEENLDRSLKYIATIKLLISEIEILNDKLKNTKEECKKWKENYKVLQDSCSIVRKTSNNCDESPPF